MSQFTFDLKVARKAVKAIKPVRVVGSNPAIRALNEAQMDWAIGHNLQWVLSIVQTEGRVQ